MPSDGPEQLSPTPVVIPASLMVEAVRVLLIHGDMTDVEREALIAGIADDTLRATLVGDEDLAEDIQQQIVGGMHTVWVLVGLLRDHAESMHGLRCGVECIARQLHAVFMAIDARITALTPGDAALFLGYCTRGDVLTVCAGQDDMHIAAIAEAFAEDDSAASDPHETFAAIIATMRDPACLDALADTITGDHREYADLARRRAAELRRASHVAPHP